MNPFNLTNPILEYSDKALYNGLQLTITGQVFDHPILSSGEEVFSIVMLIHDNVIVGTPMYRAPMTKDELIDKVKEIGENPQEWIGPDFKKLMNN